MFVHEKLISEVQWQRFIVIPASQEHHSALLGMKEDGHYGSSLVANLQVFRPCGFRRYLSSSFMKLFFQIQADDLFGTEGALEVILDVSTNWFTSTAAQQR